MAAASTAGRSQCHGSIRCVATEAERVEDTIAQPAGHVIVPDGPPLDVWVLECEDRVDLKYSNRHDNNRPECLQRRRLESHERRSVHIEQRVELLGNREAKRRQHRDTAVLQLDLR